MLYINIPAVYTPNSLKKNISCLYEADKHEPWLWFYTAALMDVAVDDVRREGASGGLNVLCGSFAQAYLSPSHTELKEQFNKRTTCLLQPLRTQAEIKAHNAKRHCCD